MNVKLYVACLELDLETDVIVKTADLFKQIVEVIRQFQNSLDNYSAHTRFSKDNDARITIFRRCLASLDMALLYEMFRTFDLPTEKWWTKIPNEFEKMKIPLIFWEPDEFNRAEIIKGMDNYWSISVFLILFNTLESSARTFVRTVFPGKVKDARGQLSKKYTSYKDVLELFRLCRNTMHNNGVYFPDTVGDNRTIWFKGIQYDFIDGNPVELGNVPRHLFFDIIPELLNIINDIVNSPRVLKHNQIIDPSAN